MDRRSVEAPHNGKRKDSIWHHLFNRKNGKVISSSASTQRSQGQGAALSTNNTPQKQHSSLGTTYKVINPSRINNLNELVCSICSSNFNGHNSIAKLPCSRHAAHIDCAEKWINRKVLVILPGCPACQRENGFEGTISTDDSNPYGYKYGYGAMHGAYGGYGFGLL